MKVVLASGNRHKYVEMKDAFASAGIELVFGGDFENPIEPEETGTTFEENATQKAEAWAKLTGLPAMSDDSGIEVDAIGKQPGINSARIVPGSDADRVDWLLDQIKDVTDPAKRTGRFVACLVIVFPDGREKLVCQRSCEGTIAFEVSKGSAGFGYDPIFIPEGYDRTFADLGDEIKRKISHRALAIKGLAEKLQLVL